MTPPKTSAKPPAETAAKTAAKPASKDKAAPRRFRAVLEQSEGSTATVIHIPFDVPEVFGTRARVPVRGRLNGHPFRTSLFPMGGRFMMVVNREMRAGAGVEGGQTISVELERDTEPRVVNPPEDFARAIEADEAARAVWEKLSYTHRKEHVRAVEEAKRPETRARRVERAVALLASGVREPR